MQKQVNVNLNFFTWQTCFNTHLNFHTYEKTTNKCTLKFLYLDANHTCAAHLKAVCCGDKTFFSYFLHALAGTCSRPITLCFSSTTHFLFKFLKEKKTNKQDFFTNPMLYVPARLLIYFLLIFFRKKNL